MVLLCFLSNNYIIGEQKKILSKTLKKMLTAPKLLNCVYTVYIYIYMGSWLINVSHGVTGKKKQKKL